MTSSVPADSIRAPWPNLATMFFDQADRLGARTALRKKADGRWVDISWADWARDARRFAGGLVKLGLAPREVVSIIGNNRPEWVVADLGTLAAGCVLVPVYVTLLPNDIHYILDHAETRVMIVENDEQLRKVLEIRERLPRLMKIVLIDGTPPADPSIMSYEDVLKLGEDATRDSLRPRYEALGPGDVATMIYTSGTTGPPKGAMITHGNILWILASANTVAFVTADDESLSFLPLCHAYERIGGLFGSIFMGATINFAQNLNTILDDLAEVRPTIFLSVPRMLEKAYARTMARIESSGAAKKALFKWALDIGRKTTPYRLNKKRMPAFLDLQYRLAERLVYSQVKQRFGGRLRYIVSAGAPLSKEIAEFFFAMDVLILEGYGMTELSAPSHINLPDAAKLGSVGRALPGVQERIAPDGEILVKAPSVFVGYWKRPAETMEALEDGWMHTGDIGHVDEDGFLYITDRKKDLIITSGGKNIAPQNIENKLKAQPFVSQAMVYGDRRKYLVALITIDGEALGQKRAAEGGAPLPADISTDAEARRLAESAVNAVNAELPSYETLKAWRLLDRDFTIDDGELTPTMKLKRKAITARFADLIEQMYPEGDA